VAATQRGPSGPFELSVGFLAMGAILALLLWKENIASSGTNEGNKLTIRDGVKITKNDPKIMLVGAVQALFEAAMYIFVLQWPPAITSAIGKVFGESIATPFGTVFSCFMASCLLGSTIFGQLTKMNIATEKFMAAMLSTATLSMGLSTLATKYYFSPWLSLASLILGFFAFEGCVGMYFPSIGTLRSKYIPDSHRSVIMNLFGIPLNILVVTVFLSMKFLGVTGALGISTTALGLSALCMNILRSKESTDEKV